MQRITHETIEDALQAIKDGAGLMSKYNGTIWKDPQTRARIIDITSSTAFEIRNIAEITYELFQYYYNGRTLRGNEVENIEYAKHVIASNRRTLEKIVDGDKEETVEVVEFTEEGPDHVAY